MICFCQCQVCVMSFLVAVASLLLLFVVPCHGCQCVVYDFPEDLCSISKSYALRGTVEGAIETGPSNDTSKGWKFYSVTVEAIYRGEQAILNATGRASIPAGSTLYVRTQRESAACGASLQSKTDYVITGDIEGGNLTTDSCSWNRMWKNISSEHRTRIAQYGDGPCSAGVSTVVLHWLVVAAAFVCLIWHN